MFAVTVTAFPAAAIFILPPVLALLSVSSFPAFPASVIVPAAFTVKVLAVFAVTVAAFPVEIIPATLFPSALPITFGRRSVFSRSCPATTRAVSAAFRSLNAVLIFHGFRRIHNLIPIHGHYIIRCQLNRSLALLPHHPDHLAFAQSTSYGAAHLGRIVFGILKFSAALAVQIILIL